MSRQERITGLRSFVKNIVSPTKKRIVALEGVNLTVPEGELFGLLGPNGAGKTTFIKILCTLLLPSHGVARVGGHDVIREADKVRQIVGVVLGGERALYWRLTGRENLWFFSQLYNIRRSEARKRIEELLAVVGLSDRADERVEGYSKGMKQRLHLARGLLNDPKILLLDEPTIGLDPKAARDIRNLVRDICKKESKTIMLTTHYMYEADELSDRVAIIDHGKIIAMDNPARLKLKLGRNNVLAIRVRNPPEALGERLRHITSVSKLVEERFDPNTNVLSLRLLTSDAENAAPTVTDHIVKLGGKLVSINLEMATLEDVFIQLTGRPIAGPEGQEGEAIVN